MTDSGVDSELSPSSPDSITEASSNMVIQTQSNTCEIVTQSAEELVARMEEEEEDDRDDENDKFVIDDEKMDDCDKMETVAALLSLSETSRSPVSSPEKPLITLLPAHSPDTGTPHNLGLYFHFQTEFTFYLIFPSQCVEMLNSNSKAVSELC